MEPATAFVRCQANHQMATWAHDNIANKNILKPFASNSYFYSNLSSLIVPS